MVREALLGSVSVQRAAGQVPEQPGVNGAEGQLAALGPLAGAGHMVQQPAQLAAGKIGIDHQPGLARDRVRQCPARFSSSQKLGRAAVLPDDGVVDGCAGLAVPDHRGFALVGDADGGDVAGLQAGLGQCLAGDANWLDQISRGSCSTQPACGKLPELLLGARADGAGVVEHDRPRTGRALIQCEDEGHRRLN